MAPYVQVIWLEAASCGRITIQCAVLGLEVAAALSALLSQGVLRVGKDCEQPCHLDTVLETCTDGECGCVEGYVCAKRAAVSLSLPGAEPFAEVGYAT